MSKAPCFRGGHADAQWRELVTLAAFGQRADGCAGQVVAGDQHVLADCQFSELATHDTRRFGVHVEGHGPVRVAYEQGGDIQGSVRNGGHMMDKTSLDYLGDWCVICRECAKTHKCVIVSNSP